MFLTVAGPAGAAIDASGTTHASLLLALRSFGDPLVRTTIQTYRPAAFELTAGLKVATDALPDVVVEAVRAALLDAFSFDARAFGQTVSLDEVVAVMHRAPGVVAVDVDVLRRPGPGPAVRPRLFAALPVVSGGSVTAAEVLTIDRSALELAVLP